MYNKHKHPYSPPLVLQTVGVLLERDFLAGGSSLPVEPIAAETTSQEVDHTDFSEDTFNFVWD